MRLAATLGILSVTGRLTAGYLFDRLPGPPVGMLSVALPAASAAVFLLAPGSQAAAMVGVFVLGLAVGSEYDTFIYLSTRYFGLRSFGSLFGFIASCILAGVGIGPLVTGYLFDLDGSYAPFLLGVIPVSLTSALLLATLGAYPEHRERIG